MSILGEKNNDEKIIKAIFEAKTQKECSQALQKFKDHIVEESIENQSLIKKDRNFLSSATKEYYEGLADKLKAKQLTKPGDIPMPETEIDKVTDNMITVSPILNGVNSVSTEYLTKLVLNAKGTQKGTWGDLTEAVVTELLNSYQTVEITQQKVSCYGQLSLDMIDMGPVFLQNHINTTLTEGMTIALEETIINGDGNKKPIGLTRNLKGTVNNGVYPLKAKVTVKDFEPSTYGNLVKQISKDENGRTKKFDKVTLIVNQNTYLTKILPAATMLDPLSGIGYKINVFPFPTDVLVSEALADDEAIMCHLNEYVLALGKGIEIVYSDEFKFLDDIRVYKAKAFADGRALDNNTSIFLDISGLEPLVSKTKVVGTVSTKEITA